MEQDRDKPMMTPLTWRKVRVTLCGSCYELCGTVVYSSDGYVTLHDAKGEHPYGEGETYEEIWIPTSNISYIVPEKGSKV